MRITSANPSNITSSTAKMIALWTVTGLLGGMFILAGSLKFVDAGMAEQFTRWGYPDWFHVFTGLIELTCGLLLLVPRTAFYAACGLAGVMIGATYTHLFHHEYPQAIVPASFLMLLLVVAAARFPLARR
jgi:uncharacterized membrane protein YphA (DoxX/SURF4 family)